MNGFIRLFRYCFFLPIAILAGWGTNYLLIEASRFLLPTLDISWSFLLAREIDYPLIGSFIRHIPMYAMFIGSSVIGGLAYGFAAIYAAPNVNKVIIYILIISAVLGSLSSLITAFYILEWDKFHFYFSNILGLIAFMVFSIISIFIAIEKKSKT